jgi:protoporphyrinogen oxidase
MSMSRSRVPVVVLGAGPAGLAAGLKLAQRGCFDVTVLERAETTGGNAGSFSIDGIRVDFGSHRLHPSCSPEILADIRGLLGADLLDRPRHGRILLRGRWVHFPLKPFDLLRSLPPSFALGVGRDAIIRRRQSSPDESFATVLERGLGRTVCRDFYFPYAEKIWGVAPEQLDAEQARRRVSSNTMARVIKKVIGGVLGRRSKSGTRFFYPRRGFGQICDAYCSAATEAGARIQLGSPVSGVELAGNSAVAVTAAGPRSSTQFPARLTLSTIPIPVLARAVSPPPSPEIQASLAELQYRAMILIYVVLATDRFSEYDAHYFPGSDIKITRLSEPKNYSMAGKSGTTVLCAELPCAVDDSSWQATDVELGELVVDALASAGLPACGPVRRIVTRRLSHAYPIYTHGYQQHFDRLDAWASGIDGLLSFGRQGLFAHDNTHHTMAMAYAACECIDDDGRIDREKWHDRRLEFESHVVED